MSLGVMIPARCPLLKTSARRPTHPVRRGRTSATESECGPGDARERAGDARQPGVAALAGRNLLDAVQGDQPGHGALAIPGDREGLVSAA
jgi:hypothetical protein